MKKKIICILLITLIIVMVGILIIRKFNKEPIKVNESTNQNLLEESNENNIATDNYELKQEFSTESVNDVENNISEQEKNENVANTESVAQTKKANSNAVTYTESNRQETQNKSEEIVEEKTETQKQVQAQTQETNNESTTTKEDIQVETKKEEYKRNNKVINDIRKVITNNESEYMKKFGYQIVEDSSITELTNQFTYTEQRVKDKILNKFGTIRIYARDYIVNGQYMWTECFII